jgi:hypothetical protein
MGGEATPFPHPFCLVDASLPLLFSCHPSPQAEDLLLLLPLPVLSLITRY